MRQFRQFAPANYTQMNCCFREGSSFKIYTSKADTLRTAPQFMFGIVWFFLLKICFMIWGYTRECPSLPKCNTHELHPRWPSTTSLPPLMGWLLRLVPRWGSPSLPTPLTTCFSGSALRCGIPGVLLLHRYLHQRY